MTMRRRQALAAAAGWIAGASLADEAYGAAAAGREALLREGEAALARGDADGAARAFGGAADAEHSLDIELGIVRSHMQAGQYRRALAFAAHTAGAHADAPEGAVLYAWLLGVGGQLAVARRVLAEADARLPGHALIADARQALEARMPIPTAALLCPPVRVAPYGSAALPGAARVVATGMRLPGGALALAPSSVMQGAGTIWTRDGLGRQHRARVERHIEAIGLALLRLEADAAALPFGAGIALADRDPFPGSPAMAIEHAAADSAQPAWPWLRHGFLGAPDAAGARRLGIELHIGPRGGPVFDTAGRWSGLALAAAHRAGGDDRLLLPSTLRKHLGDLAGQPIGGAPAARVPADAVYEAALPLVVQVIAQA